MPSTNKTPNIGIGQYLPNDVLSWDDINADNALVDTAVGNKIDKTDGGTVTGAVNFTGGLTSNGKMVSTIETGTATVSLTNSSVGYTSRSSRYFIIGKVCIVQFRFIFNGTVPTTVENLYLANLPVIPKSHIADNYVYMYGLNTGKIAVPSPQVGTVHQGGVGFSLQGLVNSTASSSNITTIWLKNGTEISGQIIYEI